MSAAPSHGLELPAATLAPHPANPREDLGDLAALEASIRELGVLEPLVVATAAAHTAGGWPCLPDGASHVILAGHRRHAAAIAAGLTTLPCILRDDLADDDALAVMLSENDPDKRLSLAPLAEARAYAQLAGRGWSQRTIATRMGCGQSHVSKRLALLRLPDVARAALAAGKITAGDATELARLSAWPGRVADALGHIGGNSWDTASAVVSRHLDQIHRAEAAAATKAKLEADGIKVVDPGQMGAYGYAKRVDPDRIEPHKAVGCLVGAAASYSGEPEYYCQDPASHEGTPDALPGWSGTFGAERDARDAERAAAEQERARAARARKKAAAALAVRPVPVARAAELLAAAVIHRSTDASSLKSAVGWLREAGIGPADSGISMYAYASRVLADPGNDTARRLAVAMALAADEQHAAAAYHEWGAREIAYLDQLISGTGYQPAEWEADKLAEAHARIQARAELSCPACGCRHDAPCAGAYPPCDAGQEQGGWAYRCHGKQCTTAETRAEATGS